MEAAELMSQLKSDGVRGQIRRSRNMHSTYQEQAQAGTGAPRPQRSI
jgi:hypothetical protein